MLSRIRPLFAASLLSLLFIVAQSQPVAETPENKEAKPYKVYTEGKQITIKSLKNINQVMLWTSSGNRVVEQKNINNSYYTFTIPVTHNAFYLMISLAGGKVYTEKIGVH